MSPAPLSGSPGEDIDGSRRKRCNVANTPITGNESRKYRAVLPNATWKEGGAWQEFGIALPFKKLLRKAGFYLSASTTRHLLFHIRYSFSILLCFFCTPPHAGPLMKCAGHEDFDLFANCAGVSYAWPAISRFQLTTPVSADIWGQGKEGTGTGSTHKGFRVWPLQKTVKFCLLKLSKCLA